VYCDTPNGHQGGIWQSGQGPASDGTSFYVSTGNGTYEPNAADTGNSVLKMGFVNGKIALQDWFTPYNSDYMNSRDWDLGVSGPVLIPGTSQVICGSKDRNIYLMNTASLGQFNAASNMIPQYFPVGGHVHGSPAFWTGPGGHLYAYVWSEQDCIKQFEFSGGLFNTTPLSQGTVTLPMNQMPGAMISVSSNISQAGTGIVWAYHVDYTVAGYQGILDAYNAQDLTQQLWNSDMAGKTDKPGTFARFCLPIVANGKVYVGTWSNKLMVYGLLPAGPSKQH
jgi:hypothetical protein